MEQLQLLIIKRLLNKRTVDYNLSDYFIKFHVIRFNTDNRMVYFGIFMFYNFV